MPVTRRVSRLIEEDKEGPAATLIILDVDWGGSERRLVTTICLVQNGGGGDTGAMKSGALAL